jgi:hypothetical protein
MKKLNMAMVVVTILLVDYRTVLPTLNSPILSINPVACSVPSAPL